MDKMRTIKDFKLSGEVINSGLTTLETLPDKGTIKEDHYMNRVSKDQQLSNPGELTVEHTNLYALTRISGTSVTDSFPLVKLGRHFKQDTRSELVVMAHRSKGAHTRHRTFRELQLQIRGCPLWETVYQQVAGKIMHGRMFIR